MFCVIFNDTGKTSRPGFSPWGEIISQHDTLEAAQAAYRERNPHLYDRAWAKAHGYSNTGTSDEIVEVDAEGQYVTTHPAD